MDEEKTKGRTWNGYACPGCRTVFRVAADFGGSDVMCPSCKETLRLPKTPEEARSQSLAQEATTTPEPAASFRPAPLPPQDHQPQEVEPSVLRAMLATQDGRLMLSLALLIPLAFALLALKFLPSKESAPAKVVQAQKSSSVVIEAIKTPEKPSPLPPPVAVTEMPAPPPSALPEVEKPPVPEVAVVQPEPESEPPLTGVVDSSPPASDPKDVSPAVSDAPDVGLVEAVPTAPSPEKPAPPAVQSEPESEPPLTGVVDSSPPASDPKDVSPAVSDAPDVGLVEAVPTSPSPEKPAPPAVQPEPEPTVAPAELVHAVVRGDTLSKISRKYQVSVATIKKVNGLKSDAIMLGQQLKIPGGVAPVAQPKPSAVAETSAPESQAARAHTVVRGDTLERIARKYGVGAHAIMQANGMKNDVVRLGRKLVIPPVQP